MLTAAPLSFWSLPLIGFAVGAISALFGVGGGFFFTPFFNVVLGLPLPVAVATSTAQIPFMAASGTFHYYRKGNLDIKNALWLGVPTILFSIITSAVIGALHFQDLPEVYNHKNIVEIVLASSFVVVVGILGIYTFFWGEPAQHKSLENRSCPSLWKVSLTVGAITGIFSAMLGIGGGVIAVPYFMMVCGLPSNRATANSLLVIFLASGMAAISYAISGLVVWKYALLVSIGTVVGAQLGAKINLGLHPKFIQKAFAILQILIVIGFAYKTFFPR